MGLFGKIFGKKPGSAHETAEQEMTEVEKLIQKLEEAEYSWCAHLVEALGESGDEKAVEPLIKALERGGKGERIVAAAALGKIGDKRAVEPLIGTLEKGGRWERTMAAEAIGKIGDKRGVEPLIKALASGDAEECSTVAGALGEIGDERAVDPLLEVLEHQCKNGKVYDNVVLALGELGNDKAVDPLVKILENHMNAAELCFWVVGALGRIRSERAIEALIGALSDYRSKFSISPIALPSVGDLANLELEQIGSAALGPLSNAITAKHLLVRERVLNLIGKIGGDKAIELLIKQLDSKKPFEGNADTASRALQMIGQPAMTALTSALADKNDKVRGRIEETIERIQRQQSRGLGTGAVTTCDDTTPNSKGPAIREPNT